MSDVNDFGRDAKEESMQEFTVGILKAYREMYFAVNARYASSPEALYECAMSQRLDLVAFVLIEEAKVAENPNHSVAHWYMSTLDRVCEGAFVE